MPDIRLIDIITPDVVTFDWLQTPTGLLDETQQLASAILIALNSDAVASPSDVLPDPRSEDRRGWWADLDAEKIWNGWPLGSKLWLLTRDKVVDGGAREGATVVRVKRYIEMALQPFIDHRICSRVVVTVASNDLDTITANILIYRGPKSVIQLNYQPIWAEISPAA